MVHIILMAGDFVMLFLPLDDLINCKSYKDLLEASYPGC